MIRALVFDFDGLVIDTELPIYHSWQELYRRYHYELDLTSWLRNVGTADVNFDPAADLCARTGRELHPQADLDWRLQRETELIAAQPVLPGVRQYLEDARRLGLKTAIASSSSCDWVTGHSLRLGLRDLFDVIVACDDVRRTKPDPELYATATAWLGVAPEQAVAFEDSLHGLQAAKRAGLHCVVVPSQLTRAMPLEAADLRLESLADLPLEDLIRRLS
ncbi:MAG: HAD family hydrolase [Chloroflexota bacterium]